MYFMEMGCDEITDREDEKFFKENTLLVALTRRIASKKGRKNLLQEQSLIVLEHPVTRTKVIRR